LRIGGRCLLDAGLRFDGRYPRGGHHGAGGSFTMPEIRAVKAPNAACAKESPQSAERDATPPRRRG